jgi:hypothetical protein
MTQMIRQQKDLHLDNIPERRSFSALDSVGLYAIVLACGFAAFYIYF